MAPASSQIFAQLGDVLLTWGWIFILIFTLWVSWEVYKFIKQLDFVGSIEWTFLQITVPEDSAQTPKAMENAFEIWAGIHKDPDISEMIFDGYMLPWYSCELDCRQGNAKYILVVPTTHAKFFEGVIYGEYPTAEVKEVEDYSQEYSQDELEKTFDLYGTELILINNDYYPIKTYREFEDSLAEDDRYIDPHQSLIEAYTNVNEGERFWVQILIRPPSPGKGVEWAKEGQLKIKELSGQKVSKPETIFALIKKFFWALPSELLGAAMGSPVIVESVKEETKLKIYNPSEDAEMKGILQKVSQNPFKVLIRLMYIAPMGQLNKPNIGKAIGVFKQFNTGHLNQFKPDGAKKTNGPNYIMKASRRSWRKRHILLDYQDRDFWGDDSGQMFSAEELATLYHFPIKYVKAPGVERATAGLGSPPDNLPYI